MAFEHEDITDVAFALTAGDWDQPHDVRARKVYSAILAERKRCAAIAKMAADMVPGGALGRANGPEHQAGVAEAGQWILTEIMEPVR